MRRNLVLFVVVATLAAGCTIPFGGRDNGNVGSFAQDLVSGKTYSKLLLEIDSAPGSEPNADALNSLKDTLHSITSKASIQVVTESNIPSEPGKKYTFNEIAALEDQHRTQHTSGDTAVLFIMFVAGGSSDDTSSGVVLGAAYRSSSIVMFKGNLRANEGSGPLYSKPAEQYLEGAVLVHEFGHAAGLVNLGAPMVRNHEDASHKGHSSNQASVMYWAIENTSGLAGIINCGLSSDCGIPQTFDADDKADLAKLKEA